MCRLLDFGLFLQDKKSKEEFFPEVIPSSLSQVVFFIVMLKTLLFVGSGSFIGGVARYLLSRFVQGHVASGFPWGTFGVNVVGCLTIGLLYGLFERGNLMNSDLRLFLTVGFCGGFTTFSTFLHENYALLEEHNFFHFAAYTFSSLFVGWLAVYLGHTIIKWI